MLDSNPLLQHLRNKPQGTKNIIVIIAALVPTLAVSYAQFYMRARSDVSDLSPTSVAENVDEKVSIFAAVGKLFDEGKKTVSTSVDTLKSINISVLDSKVISASGTPTTTGQAPSDLGAVPGVDTGNATVTKSNSN